MPFVFVQRRNSMACGRALFCWQFLHLDACGVWRARSFGRSSLIYDQTSVGAPENTSNSLGMPDTAPLCGHPGSIKLGGDVAKTGTRIAHLDHLPHYPLFVGIGHQLTGLRDEAIRRCTMCVSTSVPTDLIITVTADGIGKLVYRYGSPNFNAVAVPMTAWMSANHPDVIEAEAIGIGNWTSVEEATANGVLMAEYSAEWATYLEENGCAYNQAFPSC